MIGIALAAIAYGMIAVRSSRNRPTSTATITPAEQPIAKPPSASLNVYQPALQSTSRSSQNVRAISLGGGSRKRWTCSAATSPSQSASAEHEHRDRREPLAGGAHRAPEQALARDRRDGRSRSLAPPRRRSSASRPEPPWQRLAHARDELEEARVLARRVRPRLRQVDRDDLGDPARPRRHHDDARREEDRLGDRVRDEDDRRAASPARSGAARRSAARGSSRRARRTARPSAGAPARTRARARSRRAAACRRRAATGGASRSRSARRGRASRCTRSCAPAPVPAEQLERQRDVPRDGPPVVEHGVLEDDPVVAVEPRLVRGLAVDDDLAGGRLDQVADDPQQRRLAAARRPDQRDELARLDLEVDLLAARRRSPLREALAPDGRGARRRRRRVMRRAPARLRTTILSTQGDERKNEIPSSAAMRFVAQRLGGELT